MKRNKQNKRTRENRRSNRGRRRRRSDSFLHFGRGLVMEGMGVAMLAMLYWTIQASSTNEVVEQAEPTSVSVAAQAPTQIQIPRHIANSKAGRNHLNW